MTLLSKTFSASFAPYNTFGEEEVQAGLAVLKKGMLSQFIGAWHPSFYGGEQVLAFEEAWQTAFQVPYAISMNSATSGLIAALGAIGLEPGEEVIVSPWTMSASATAILVWNGIPVFADIQERTFNLDPQAIEKNLSSKTRAIVVPDIFGHAADLKAILSLAQKHQLVVIEDASQAPGALYYGQYVGTLADIGVFSLNYHKHIHTGEGGMCVTRNPEYAERMQLIRNHAEAVAPGKGIQDLHNLIGFNFRLGEIEAAIGKVQLQKLPHVLQERIRLADLLISRLQALPGLRLPIIEEKCTHVFYVFPLILDLERLSLPRKTIVEALKQERIPGIVEGYANLHLLPMYQKKIAYGKNHFPWIGTQARSVCYDKGICPVAEKLHDESYMSFLISLFQLTEKDVDLIAKAFFTVWERFHLL